MIRNVFAFFKDKIDKPEDRLTGECLLDDLYNIDEFTKYMLSVIHDYEPPITEELSEMIEYYEDRIYSELFKKYKSVNFKVNPG